MVQINLCHVTTFLFLNSSPPSRVPVLLLHSYFPLSSSHVRKQKKTHTLPSLSHVTPLLFLLNAVRLSLKYITTTSPYTIPLYFWPNLFLSYYSEKSSYEYKFIILSIFSAPITLTKFQSLHKQKPYTFYNNYMYFIISITYPRFIQFQVYHSTYAFKFPSLNPLLRAINSEPSLFSVYHVRTSCT